MQKYVVSWQEYNELTALDPAIAQGLIASHKVKYGEWIPEPLYRTGEAIDSFTRAMQSSFVTATEALTGFCFKK